MVKKFTNVIIFCLLNSHLALSQVDFPKTEIYKVWLLAESKLQTGNLGEATKFYKFYPENPTFVWRAKQLSHLTKIGADGEKLFRRKQFALALEKYKEYRKLEGIGTLGYLEQKIERCLEEIARGKREELTVQQRIIAGFEFAHRGRGRLAMLDTAGARVDFAKARLLGAQKNNVLREQVNDGRRVLKQLEEWSLEYRKAQENNLSDSAKLLVLEGYRNIRGLDLPQVELEIKTLKSSLSGINSVADLAKGCDIDLIISYVERNRSAFEMSSSTLYRLGEFRSTLRKIEELRARTGNSETIKSAYESLLMWGTELPSAFREEIIGCIKNQYTDYLATVKASSVPVNDCSGIPMYRYSIKLARKEFSDCNLKRAAVLLSEAKMAVAACEQFSALSKEIVGISDSVQQYIHDDSLLQVYRGKISYLSRGECDETTRILNLMGQLRTCTPATLRAEVVNGLANLTNCGKVGWWRPQLAARFSGVKPRYKIGDTSLDTGIGWFGALGLELAYIDHKNVGEFVVGVNYFNCYYYTKSNSGDVLQDFNISGVNGNLSIKLHLPDTNPGKIRFYLKFGPELQLPVSYSYHNYATSQASTDRKILRSTMLFVCGGIGAEIQKKKFGAFVELSASSGLGNMYRSERTQVSPGRQKVEASFSSLGISAGIRFW